MCSIQIRPFQPSDADALYAAARESIQDVYPWLAWCHPAYTRDESVAWLIMQAQEREQQISFQFAVLDADNQLLGGVAVNELDWQTGTANLGYWIRSSAAGRGIAVAAVNLLTD